MQDVEPSELVGHGPDGTDHRRLVGEVDGHGERPAAAVADLPGHPFGPGPVDVEHGHRGTLAGQGPRRGAADAAGPSGDHGHPALDPPVAVTAHLGPILAGGRTGTGRSASLWSWSPLCATRTHDGRLECGHRSPDLPHRLAASAPASVPGGARANVPASLRNDGREFP